MADQTILVVDDERAIVSLLADVLEDEGYHVRRAYDGRAALEDVDRAPPDLVLADMMMPRLGGAGLVAQLRERGDETPVVLMSAVYADVDLPGVTFIRKPFDLERVLSVIDRSLAAS